MFYKIMDNKASWRKIRLQINLSNNIRLLNIDIPKCILLNIDIPIRYNYNLFITKPNNLKFWYLLTYILYEHQIRKITTGDSGITNDEPWRLEDSILAFEKKSNMVNI
jgi:hypothetical protein